jgi:hypothetical protein
MPTFSSWIVAEHARENVFSIEKVGDELAAIDDELARWADQRPATFFLKPDAAVVPALGTVSRWAASQRYEPVAVNTFLQKADFYLVAHALAHQFTLVTHEVPSASTRKIKIPDACIGLGVKVVSTFEMLRNTRARFVLGR